MITIMVIVGLDAGYDYGCGYQDRACQVGSSMLYRFPIFRISGFLKPRVLRLSGFWKERGLPCGSIHRNFMLFNLFNLFDLITLFSCFILFIFVFVVIFIFVFILVSSFAIFLHTVSAKSTKIPPNEFIITITTSLQVYASTSLPVWAVSSIDLWWKGGSKVEFEEELEEELSCTIT